MFKKTNDVITFIKKKNVEEIDLKYVDLEGRLHHLTLPANKVNKKSFEEGEGIDASSLQGFASVESADAVIIPDIRTGFLDVVKRSKTISFICDVCDCEKRKSIPSCPRGLAKRAEKYLRKTGIADDFIASPEFEFHIFDKVSFNIKGDRSLFKVISSEAPLDEDNACSWIREGGGYHIEEPFDKLHSIRCKITEGLEDAGIPVKYHHHEGGGPSQVEIEVLFKPLLGTADDIVKAKYLIRKISEQSGKIAIFLPKPLNIMSGNGMHIHLYLEKSKKSIFYDKEGLEDLSKSALYFIGGIIKHGRAITGFACASTNSFRRLIPGYKAPVLFSYSAANRSAAIRIPLYVSEPTQKRIEFRISDATSNPYLLLSSLLLAGIDGIKNKIDPGRPSNINLYKKKIAGLTPIPDSFEEALGSLDVDREFLKQGDVFNDRVIDEWLRIKREDIKRVRKSVHPIEYELFFDI